MWVVPKRLLRLLWNTCANIGRHPFLFHISILFSDASLLNFRNSGFLLFFGTFHSIFRILEIHFYCQYYFMSINWWITTQIHTASTLEWKMESQANQSAHAHYKTHKIHNSAYRQTHIHSWALPMMNKKTKTKYNRKTIKKKQKKNTCNSHIKHTYIHMHCTSTHCTPAITQI